MNSNLCVLKFGGSSLSTPEKIQSVATRIAQLAREGKKLVVVVSAMGQTTDDLLALARRVSPHPNRRELDMLLTTGERISMSLMSMALHDQGCPSISFTGSQAGVMTNGSFSNADIVDIRPIRVAQELRRRRVVVLAGFQGVDPKTKEITTLGRGGSDTTAIAMASTLGAARCEIYKDVDGVYGADPKFVPNAPLYKTVPLFLLHEFCHWGAKVLNVRSVEWAIKGNVPIFVGRSSDFSLGTSIVPEKKRKKYEIETNILGLHSHAHVLDIVVKTRTLAEATRLLRSQLKGHTLPMPVILSSKQDRSGSRLFVTLDSETLKHIQHALDLSKHVNILRDDVSSIAVTRSSELVFKKSDWFRGLAAEMAVHQFSTTWSDVVIVPTSARTELMQSIGSALF